MDGPYKATGDKTVFTDKNGVEFPVGRGLPAEVCRDLASLLNRENKIQQLKEKEEQSGGHTASNS